MKSPPVGLSHELTGISCSDQQRNSVCSSRAKLGGKRNTSTKEGRALSEPTCLGFLVQLHL